MAEGSTSLTWTRMTDYHGDSGKTGVLPGRSWDHRKMGDWVRWKDSQRRRDIHCLRDKGQRKHNKKRDVKMFMNEKARDRERMQCTHTRKWWREKRILKRFGTQQNLGQKKNTCPLNTSDPENDGSGRVEAPRDPSANPLTQHDGYVIVSLGCPVQTPCVNIKLDFPMDY